MVDKKTKKAETSKKEEGRFSANELMGVSDIRAKQIAKAFQHAMIDHDTWTAVYKQVVEDVQAESEGDFAYIGYVFGRKYEEHENMHNPFKALDHMLKHH